MTVPTFVQPDSTAQNGNTYKANIDAAIGVLARMGQMFAGHEQSTPDMTVRLDAGAIWDPTGLTITEVAAQSTGTITAPSSNPRIDRVVIDQSTGAVSVITGAEAASPSAPSITSGKFPVCQIALTTGTTEIDNSIITDERPGAFIVVPTSTGATDSEKANILLNSFRIAVNGGLSVQNMVDGFVDEFEDETGVDTASSTNEVYDSTNDYYVNYSESTEDAGISRNNDAAAGYTTIDRNFAVDNSATVNKISMYSEVSATVVVKIALENSSTDLDIVYSESFSHGGTGWETFTLATPYSVPGSGTYRLGVYSASAYSGHTSSGNCSQYSGEATGSSETYTAQAYVYGLMRAHYLTVNNMTLISNSVTALAQPDEVFLVVWEEDVDTITLNTDLLAYASRDGGTTWTQGTLSKEATLGNAQILTATVDVSGQPSGTSMEWKLVTANTKQLIVHAVGELWS